MEGVPRLDNHSAAHTHNNNYNLAVRHCIVSLFLKQSTGNNCDNVLAQCGGIIIITWV